jgi:hypothetical protein
VLTEMILFLTSSLHIHLNLGQNLTINTSRTFMTLETISLQPLENKLVKQVGNTQFQIPSNFTLNTKRNFSILLRVSRFLTWLFFDSFFPIVENKATGIIWEFKISNKYQSFHINITFNYWSKWQWNLFSNNWKSFHSIIYSSWC